MKTVKMLWGWAILALIAVMLGDRFWVHPPGRYQLDNHGPILRLDTMTGKLDCWTAKGWAPMRTTE